MAEFAAVQTTDKHDKVCMFLEKQLKEAPKKSPMKYSRLFAPANYKRCTAW